MARIAWPEEVDPNYIRSVYPDLASLADTDIRGHHEVFGRHEGRIASLAAAREHFIELPPEGCSILEVGPSCRPVFAGPGVRYCDVLDAAEIRTKGVSLGLDISRSPEKIHYTTGLADAADGGFDIVFGSHNIEHQPDLVTHLREVAAALAPGGFYMLIIPDRRYCFDHFLPDSQLHEVLGAFIEKRTVHTAADVIAQHTLTCHNDTVLHWQGDHGEQPSADPVRVAQSLALLDVMAGAYIDVHAWQFTPRSFRALIEGLNALGLSPLTPVRIYDTINGRCEFTAVLQAPESV